VVNNAAAVAAELKKLCREVREHEPLRRHVSFRIGGPADILVLPRSADELRKVAGWLFQHNIPFEILGQGSNVLIADAGIRGVVIKIGKGLDRFSFDGTRLVAEAGTGLPHLARAAATKGLSGLEFAAGIPASVGGAVVMNAGAHGHAMSEVLREVRALAPEGERVLGPSELGLAYRTTVLQQRKAVVLEATMELTRSDAVTVRARTDEWLKHRSDTQPIGPPSSGCVFRNPSGDHAGRLIDVSGAKGLAQGGARVSEIHANYIVNAGEATAADVVALMYKVSGMVVEKCGVRLEPEIKLLGEFAQTTH
jgi:UDP-N-acetylmuramate dehydrogenase